MNAYTFNPRTISSASSANFVLGLWQNLINIEIGDIAAANSLLEAERDALQTAHPEIENPLAGVIEVAIIVGNAEGMRQALTQQMEDFRSILISRGILPRGVAA